MTEQIITSMADLDDLDLDLETDGISELTDSAEIETVAQTSNDSDDLTLDDLEDETIQPVASNSQETDDLKLDDETTESIDDLKLDDETLPTPTDKVVPELVKKPIANLDDEIELDLDVNDGVKKPDVVQPEPVQTGEVVVVASGEGSTKVEPVVEEPKSKRGRKAKVKEEPSLVINKSTKYLDPSFPLASLDVEKYITRTTIRSDEDITILADKIKSQGQAEPLHAYASDDGKFYLLAGFGRYQAMTEKLGLTTAEVYVHKNLTEADIYKICSGTNEPRTALTEWDKIVSIGKYYDNNPNVPTDDENNPASVVRVFGYSRSAIYNYLKAWAVYKNKPVLADYFNRNGNNIAGYVYQILAKAMEEYKGAGLTEQEWGTILGIATQATNRKLFIDNLIRVTGEYILTNKPATNLTGQLDSEMSESERVINAVVGEENEAFAELLGTKRLQDKEDELKVTALESDIVREKTKEELIDECYQNVISVLTQSHAAIDCLLVIEDYQALRKPAEVKRIKELIMLIADGAKKL